MYVHDGLWTGKADFKADSRDWLWSDFRAPLKKAGLLARIPKVFGHGNTYRDWQMLANGPDSTAPGKAAYGCGCCVWSSAANETKIALTDADPSTSNVSAVGDLFNGATTVADYSACTGYDPATGQNDNGTEIRARLEYQRKIGILDLRGQRHKIGAYYLVEPGNLQHMLEVLYFAEGAPIGLQMQEAQMQQFQRAEERGTIPVWYPVNGSAQIGGHCVCQAGRPDDEHVTGLSWRRRVFMTEPFIEKQADEFWGYSTTERISKVTGKTYEGITPEVLEEYFHMLAKEMSNA